MSYGSYAVRDDHLFGRISHICGSANITSLHVELPGLITQTQAYPAGILPLKDCVQLERPTVVNKGPLMRLPWADYLVLVVKCVWGCQGARLLFGVYSWLQWKTRDQEASTRLDSTWPRKNREKLCIALYGLGAFQYR